MSEVLEWFDSNYKVSERLAALVTQMERQSTNGGEVIRLWLDNGYGLSLAQHSFSYSDSQSVEVAVIRRDSSHGFELDYDTPIADDVLGYQTLTEVMSHLQKLSELPAVRR